MALRNAVELKSRRRPAGVWVVSVYYFFSAGYTLVKFTLARSGLVELDPLQKSYFASLSPGDYLLVVVSACLMLSGAIFLFLMRRIAFPLFCAALALSASITVWNILTRHLTSKAAIGSLIGAGVAWTIMLLVCIYTARLRAQGVLK